MIGIGQNRSINSIQKALVPEKNTFLVDALRVKSKLNRGPNIVDLPEPEGPTIANFSPSLSSKFI